jgi:uncharacterized protein YjdB
MSVLPRKISAARALISLLPCLLLAACGSSSTPAITAITLSPTTLTLMEGATHPALAVSSVDSAGTTATVTTGIAWSSSATTIASVDATSGVITAGTHAGTATITATITESGANISNSATVTVTAPVPTVTGITIAPATLSLQIGATGTLAVTGHYSDSTTAAITSGITWSSGTAAVASVSTAGVVTALTAGSATITASVTGPAGALTAQATVTVAAAAVVLTSIAVSPTTLSVAAGATHAALTVTGTSSNGAMAAITSGITWSSSASSVASVASTGIITAGSASGTATITATVAGPSGNLTASSTVTVTVPAPTLTSITATASIALAAGATASAPIAVTAHYSDNSMAAVTTGVTFVSGNSATASVSASGLVTAGSAGGSTTITSTYSGQTATTTVTVTAAVSSYAILDFNTALGSGFAYATTAFGGSISSITSTGIPSGGPSTAGPKFASITIPAAGGPQCYAGTTLSVGYNASIGQVPFTATNTTVKMAIYVPTGAVGKVVDVKFEDANDTTHSVETRQTFAASGWQTLTFDLSMQASGTAALNPAFTFDKVSVFPDFTCVSGAPEPTADEVFFIASLTFIGASAPAAPPLSAPPPPAAPTTAPSAPTLTAAQVIYILSSYFTAHSGTPHAIDNWSEFSDRMTAPPAPVTIAGDAMYEFQFSGANGYDGISFGDHAANTATQVDGTGKTAMHLDVWFSTSSAFMVQLIDNAAAGGTAKQVGAYTVPAANIPAKTWVSLDITFAQFGLTAIANLQQIVLQPTDAATNVYVDNLYFH